MLVYRAMLFRKKSFFQLKYSLPIIQKSPIINFVKDLFLFEFEIHFARKKKNQLKQTCTQVTILWSLVKVSRRNSGVCKK